MKTRNVGYIALLWVAASACHAQQVIHACRGAAGAIAYQDAPCAGGTGEVAVRTYTTPHDAPDAARRVEAIDRQLHAQWARDRQAGTAVARRRGALTERALPDGRDLDRRRCRDARAAVSRATRSRAFRGDRAALEAAVVDACFAL